MISVIMPVFNHVDYLKESIDSILNQTYEDIEFIIIDDGSTEPVWDILNQYDDPRIVKMRNKENIGLTKSLNICLDNVNGDFIARHDSDDISLPTRFEEEMKGFDDEIGLVTTYGEAMNEHGEKMSYRYLDIDSRKKGDIRKGNYFVGASVVFRKEVFDKVGYYDETLYIAQDYNYWIRALKYFDHVIIEKVLYRIRKHKKSVRTCHVEFRHLNWNKLCLEKADKCPIIKSI